MTIRKRTRVGKDGARKEAWMVDFWFALPGEQPRRFREQSPVNTRRGAEQYERQLRQSLLDGTYEQAKEAVEPSVPTLDEFFPKFIEHGKGNQLKAGTVAEYESIYKNHLAPRWGARRLDEIKTKDVARLKLDLSEKSEKTVNNVLVGLSRCLKVAVEWQVIDEMPCQIRLLKVNHTDDVEFYEFAQLDELLNAAQRLGPKLHVYVLLGAHAGLRSGEVQGLEWEDVDWKRGVVTVQRRVHKGDVDSPKSRKLRRVDMTHRLQDALKALPRHLHSKRVLVRDDGGEVTQRVLERWMDKIQQEAGMTVDSKIHKLRHTFCSHLAMRGAPAIAIKELAGHASLATTQRYMHLSPAEKRRAVSVLETALQQSLGTGKAPEIPSTENSA